MKYTKVLVVVFVIVAISLLGVQHHITSAMSNHKAKPVTLDSLVNEMNYCTPKGKIAPTWTYEGVKSVMHPADPIAVEGQKKIIADTKAMTEYTGTQNTSQYGVLVENYQSDVDTYDTCSLTSF